MITFNSILNEGVTSNSLMKGINLDAPLTTKDRQVEAIKNELKQIVMNIVRQFLDVMQKNRLLSVECLFRLESKD